MNIVLGRTKEEYCYITTAGARYFVRLFMHNRQGLEEAGYALPSPCAVTWLGQDDGFAADLAHMAVVENRRGCILSDPIQAVFLPIGSVVIIPCLTQDTAKEWNNFRFRRLQFTGIGNDSIAYAVAGYKFADAAPQQYICAHIDGPLLKVHCEWVARN